MDNKKIKILIADDDKEIRQMYTEIFESNNFDVIEAKDGVEGLDIATREMPDVIFTGIIMPRMDGFMMTEALKKNVQTGKIPVVFLSHMGREEDRQKAMSLGARDFIIRDETPPVQVVKRINDIFFGHEGYYIDFDSISADAQKLMKDANIKNDFRCENCNGKLVLKLKIKNTKNRNFDAELICPSCG